MDREQIKQLIADLEASKLQKIIIKRGDFELHLEKQAPAPVAPAPVRTVIAENATESAFQAELSQKGERGGGRKPEAEGKYVTSPMVGTFYPSPAPDQPPFVKVGDMVEEGTIVCIIEAMKVMNEVKAGVAGKIAEILIDNAQPVEFGSKLLRIV
ncbi:MAG: acetyl-CoA carboxylase biotin carboxyl carrier protein [Verrucomicrobiota bacterium]|nr:acetyl-CoA carboxylase biotin carboxyl carrier protein [Verrucomicrobiota bacterium]